MAQQRKKPTAAASAKKASAAAANSAPLLKNVSDPAPFFSLGAASFTDAIVITKVISVVLPLRHLRDRSILDEVVIKKLLHRPFEPSAEDFAQQQQEQQQRESTHHGKSDVAETSARGSAALSSSSLTTSSPSSAAPYVIVHIKSIEVHADTARQINPQGDVQVNVMTTLVAARVQHGLTAGVAETSAFATCMQVRIPTVAVSAAVAADEKSAREGVDALPLELAPQENSEAQNEHPTAAHTETACQLRVTARCLEDEPVVPGQAVLLVSEPAAMRCLAIRPPRDAPGPFYIAEDTILPSKSAAPKRRRAPRKSGGDEQTGEAAEGEATAAVAAEDDGGVAGRVVVIACDVPEMENKHKRPRS